MGSSKRAIINITKLKEKVWLIMKNKTTGFNTGKKTPTFLQLLLKAFLSYEFSLGGLVLVGIYYLALS